MLVFVLVFVFNWLWKVTLAIMENWDREMRSDVRNWMKILGS